MSAIDVGDAGQSDQLWSLQARGSTWSRETGRKVSRKERRKPLVQDGVLLMDRVDAMKLQPAEIISVSAKVQSRDFKFKFTLTLTPLQVISPRNLTSSHHLRKLCYRGK